MKRNKLNRRLEEDIWGLITLKGKKNKVTKFFQSLLKEKFSQKDRKNVIYRVEIEKPKRKNISLSDYGKLLVARRKLSLFYGGLRKRTLEKIKKEIKEGTGKLSDLVIEKLENRLEIVVYRLNFANSVREARKDILKGMIAVNKKIIKQPGYEIKIGDLIEIVPGYKEEVQKRILRRIKENWLYTNIVPYLEVNYKILVGSKIMKANMKNVVYPFKLKENYIKGFITEKG